MKLSVKLAVLIFFAISLAIIISSLSIPLLINLIVKPLPHDNLMIRVVGYFVAFFAIVVVCIIPISIAVWFILAKMIIGPVANFTHVTKIISSGNLGERIKLFSQDEIGDLGRNINTMIDHLAGAFQNMANSLKNERNKEKELAASLNQLMIEKAKDDALLTSMGDAVIAIDKDKKILVFNKAATDLTGVNLNEALNAFYENILVFVEEKEGIPVEDFIKDALMGMEDKKLKHIAIVSRSGQRVPVSYSLGIVYDNDKNIVGVVVVLRDITYERMLDKMKDEFLSIASHELRTPMSAIKNLISMIFEGDYGEINEKLKDPLKDIGTSTERLIQLVNDMLDVSRIESGRLKIVLEDVHMKDLVEEVVKLMQPLVLQKQIKLVAENIGSEMIRTDVNKIKEVLNNLIGNAIKFTDQGQIVVSSKRAGNLIYISVTDSGIGIAKEDQSKLFSKFSQVNTNQFVRPAGTGLGLYISREFVRKLGGELWIERSEEGKGSTFTFSLPVLETGNFAQS